MKGVRVHTFKCASKKQQTNKAEIQQTNKRDVSASKKKEEQIFAENDAKFLHQKDKGTRSLSLSFLVFRDEKRGLSGGELSRSRNARVIRGVFFSIPSFYSLLFPICVLDYSSYE